MADESRHDPLEKGAQIAIDFCAAKVGGRPAGSALSPAGGQMKGKQPIRDTIPLRRSSKI